jgi:imidazolonepropionase-like amidohydrolase
MARFPLVAALLAALAPVGCSAELPAANVHRPMPSPDGSQLALMSDRDGNWELYVIDLTDGASRRITDDPGFDGYADWSPNGRYLYFGRSGELLRFDLETGTEQRLGEGGALRLSPDGSEIVFQSERSGDRELYRMAADGSDVQRLTEHPGNDADAVYSPDGARIAHVSAVGEHQEVAVMNRDGSGRRQITEGVVGSYGTDWSPDGRSIVFSADIDGDHELFLVGADGGEVRRLTHHPGVDHMPVFWPDGHRILYTAYVGEGEEELEELRMLELDSTSPPITLRLLPDGRMSEEALEQLLHRPETVVFRGVNVVPMDDERVLRDRTVVVQGGRIAAIEGAGTAAYPESARVIEGKGRYLFPGLMDLHTHPDTPRSLELYLAHGVTTIRDMGGDPSHLARRELVGSGALPGPSLYVAGPPLYVEGEAGDQRLHDPEAARQTVREIAAAGYDLVKIVRLDPPTAVGAVIDEARRAGLRVAGHLPSFSWSLDELAGSGMFSVEHITEVTWLAFHGRTEAAEIPAAVETLRAGGIAVGTLFTSGLRAKRMIELGKAYLDSSDAAEMALWCGPNAAGGARSYLEFLAGREAWEIERRKIDRGFAMQFLRALYRAGVPLLAGTDSQTPWAIAGRSLHDELALLVEAGLTPYEALRTATVLGATALGIEAEAGTIRSGGRADLLLVAENPLDELATLRHPEGVVAAGRWYDPGDLRRLRADPHQ